MILNDVPDERAQTPTEVDDALAEAAKAACGAPDPQAWQTYDALLALAELRPVSDEWEDDSASLIDVQIGVESERLAIPADFNLDEDRR